MFKKYKNDPWGVKNTCDVRIELISNNEGISTQILSRLAQTKISFHTIKSVLTNK